MSHLDCTVYAACVSKERSVQTAHFQLNHTVRLTQGNRHTQTYSHRKWRGLARVLSEGVRDQTLCCCKGHVGEQLTPILCREQMCPHKTHTGNRTEHLYAYIESEYRHIPPHTHTQAEIVPRHSVRWTFESTL